jgi:hypothetical protein
MVLDGPREARDRPQTEFVLLGNDHDLIPNSDDRAGEPERSALSGERPTNRKRHSERGRDPLLDRTAP